MAKSQYLIEGEIGLKQEVEHLCLYLVEVLERTRPCLRTLDDLTKFVREVEPFIHDIFLASLRGAPHDVLSLMRSLRPAVPLETEVENGSLTLPAGFYSEAGKWLERCPREEEL